MSVGDVSLQLKNVFTALTPAKKLTLAFMIIGSAAGFIFLMSWTGKQDFQHLYSNLAAEDAGDILSFLKERKIPYQVAGKGDTILVPSEKVQECRIELASRGLPQNSGVGFEVFDNTKLGMTEFVQNVNYQRALQGELARTINNISEVESSRVHLVMPSTSLFVEDQEPASASIVLKLRRGKWLTRDQVQGIVHLASSSVSRLRPENVTVVDTTGKLLAGNSDPDSMINLSSDQLEYQEKFERTLENRVKTMLENALGRGKAIVRLSCALDFKRQEMTEEKYYPENRVIRSEQVLMEKSAEPALTPAGVPGVRSNINRKTSGTLDNGRAESEKQDRTVNYEIGKITSRIVEPATKIKKISVAVILDGTYLAKKKRDGSVEWVYAPRKAEEIKRFENIVKGAINFDADRGDKVEVINIPFETEKAFEQVAAPESASWLDKLTKFSSLLRYTFMGIVVLLLFLFVVRPLINWFTTSAMNDMELIKKLPKTVGEIENEYGKESGSMPYRDELNQLLASHGDVTMGVTQEWMKDK